jgi:hypothetical protein
MKTKYISPKVTVVPFVVEKGYNGSVGYSSAQHDDVLFHFTATDNTGSRFGNDQFSNIAGNNSDYNFFGD